MPDNGVKLKKLFIDYDGLLIAGIEALGKTLATFLMKLKA